MKIDEVPQDGAYMKEGKIRDLCYVTDKDGHYTSKLSLGWTPKNEAIKLAWEQVYEQAEETRKKVLAGVLSPIAFYMQLKVMDLAILANYVGISKWKVRRHLKMKHFKNIKDSLLIKYAEALDLNPSDLVNIDRIREIVIQHED